MPILLRLSDHTACHGRAARFAQARCVANIVKESLSSSPCCVAHATTAEPLAYLHTRRGEFHPASWQAIDVALSGLTDAAIMTLAVNAKEQPQKRLSEVMWRVCVDVLQPLLPAPAEHLLQVLNAVREGEGAQAHL